MARNRNKSVGLGAILFHTIMVLITGGIWGIGLIIWFMLSGRK